MAAEPLLYTVKALLYTCPMKQHCIRSQLAVSLICRDSKRHTALQCAAAQHHNTQHSWEVQHGLAQQMLFRGQTKCIGLMIAWACPVLIVLGIVEGLIFECDTGQHAQPAPPFLTAIAAWARSHVQPLQLEATNTMQTLHRLQSSIYVPSHCRESGSA